VDWREFVADTPKKKWVPLQVKHKGKLTRVKQLIQEDVETEVYV